jgi:hypothetical protein
MFPEILWDRAAEMSFRQKLLSLYDGNRHALMGEFDERFLFI